MKTKPPIWSYLLFWVTLIALAYGYFAKGLIPLVITFFYTPGIFPFFSLSFQVGDQTMFLFFGLWFGTFLTFIAFLTAEAPKEKEEEKSFPPDTSGFTQPRIDNGLNQNPLVHGAPE